MSLKYNICTSYPCIAGCEMRKLHFILIKITEIFLSLTTAN